MTSVNSRRWSNWGRNQESIAEVLLPGGVDEVASQVKQAVESGRRIKVVGSGHSFTPIAVAEDQRMFVHRLDGLVAVDGPLVTVQAGMPLSTLNEVLAEHGLAMPNLGDIDAQTVAGAISTGTHGTGIAYSTLASCVEAVTMVTGDGTVQRFAAGDPEFPAVRLGLGALGVLVDVTLRCVPAFTLLADERPMALADILAGMDEWIASDDHVEFFWYPYTDRAQLKRNRRVEADDRPLSRFRGWFDDDFLSNTVLQGVCTVGRRFPATVPAISAVSARALSPRTYTGRSDRVFCSPRRVKFTEMEYEVPRAALPEVIAALPKLLDALPFRVQFPVEVRFTGPDDVWLSHGYGRESAYIAVHQFIGSPYEPYFRAFEELCTPLGGRPHWGKLHYRDAESLRPAYPRFDDFLAVRDRLDPHRVFTNDYLVRVLGS
ncbi:FAD-linked oxidoreductase [Actinoplanes campanulatus]|uniref:FAD-linked oxidoreductase n=1 Tax=Actinoplanes campanulatus TaxID=113559 RepID=A0A7W5FIT3_9ACTN|nr:D-arabinono-1,4-lactone oxidase [Actinoplanes campanulatus]MBB3099790.1 FAD-linked oxidoreductase [Actinoplanes campanulatus]GGN47153.1 FAD-linked oxidoreductase [Actinoplanes campanulatus]GID40351.1 FAD-linked oxidoreductase [Actinoplanes campanulatus]